MEIKDLLWVQPDFPFGADEPARARKRKSRKTEASADAVETNHSGFFTVKQLAGLWNLSEDVIRKEFENEPGVLKLARKRKGKRPYKTLRIPRDVADRVKTRLSS
jgi:hypothetical protein